MSKFARTESGIERLVDNSFKAIDEGAYNKEYSLTHDAVSIRKAVSSCPHAPLITEVKFSSPSQGKIRSKTSPAEIAATMVSAGAVGLSVLTQPYLFDGSIEYLAAIRKSVSAPLLMKDITVSTVQIDAGKKAGADCILLIKTIFDKDLAEESMEKLAEHATKKGLQVLVEVHTEQEFAEMLKGCDAYIATGSNNSAGYFEYYFKKYPHIIRRNRTSVAILTGTETRGSGRNSGSVNLQDAEYIRLKQVALAYNFDPQILRKAGLSGAKLYVMGVNLWTYTEYLGYDPEWTTGNALGIIPQSRNITAGVQLTF